MYFVTRLLRSYMTSAALRARLCDWALVRATGVAYLYLVCCCDFTLLFIAVSNNTIYIIESVCYVRQWSCDNLQLHLWFAYRVLHCFEILLFIHSFNLVGLYFHSCFSKILFFKVVYSEISPTWPMALLKVVLNVYTEIFLNGPWPFSVDTLYAANNFLNR